MTNDKQDVIKLRSHLTRLLLTATILTLAITTLVSLYVASHNFQQEQDRHFEALNITVGELTRPSLVISDYSEAQRLLGLINGHENLIVTIVTSNGDVLLSDYVNLSLVKKYIFDQYTLVGCEELMGRIEKVSNLGYRVYCSNILEPNHRAGSIPLGVVLSFQLKKNSVIPFSTFISLIILLFGAFLFSFIFIRILVNKRIIHPLEKLTEKISSVAIDPLLANNIAIGKSSRIYKEFQQIEYAFQAVLERFRIEHEKRNIAEKKEALFNLATQIAHDIRSPLAALNSTLSTLEQLPEEKRLVVRSAISRIRDIANNLLEQQRSSSSLSKNMPASSFPHLDTHLISSIIDSLVSEKRLQFRSRLDLEIEATLTNESYGLFARVSSAELKRILSNIINNSAEAIVGSGYISVEMIGNINIVELKITDNGSGVSAELLPALPQRGFTHGKVDGTGLGLYHAKTTLESWGGELMIQSTLGRGTTVILRIPRCDPPEWFARELYIPADSILAVIDDDQSIHQIWRGRAESARLHEQNVKLVHFSSPNELKDWIPENNKTTLYLVDYEFLGSHENGLDLIESAGIAKQSILVTSRFEEAAIYERCLRLGVRMVPKGMAGFVPIRIENTLTACVPLLDAVLIDDDTLVHTLWKMSAHEAGKNIRAYKAAETFIAQADQIPSNTPIYIDSNLGGSESGEIVAARLHDRGFSCIYLATGYEPSQFAHLTYLKGVVGKDPPWG